MTDVFAPFRYLMNVLIFGDGHVYGQGLSVGQLSYVAWFMKLISRTGRAVSVDAYAHLTLPQTLSALAHLPLNRYDLIIIQPGHDWFGWSTVPVAHDRSTAQLVGRFVLPPLHQPAGRPESVLPPEKNKFLINWAKLLMARVSAGLYPYQLKTPVTDLLASLRPYRHNVLLLTPFPHRNPVCQMRRRYHRTALLREGNRQLFGVFDSQAVVLPREEYFLPGSAAYLNAVSHELLGRALFDFYQSAPAIVTIQSIKPD